MPTEPSPGGRPRIQIPATESEQQSPSHWPRSGQTSRVGYGRSPNTMVIETAFEEERAEHLSFDKHDPCDHILTVVRLSDYNQLLRR